MITYHFYGPTDKRKKEDFERHHFLGQVQQSDNEESVEDAWIEFAKMTELYTERPRYASEDIGETIAMIVDSFKESGVVVKKCL